MIDFGLFVTGGGRRRADGWSRVIECDCVITYAMFVS